MAGVHDLVGEGEWAPDFDAALGGTDAGAFTLFVAHQPLAALDVEGRGVDLQLSGHTHGGQMWPINYLVPLQQPMLEGMADRRGHHRRHLPWRRGLGPAGPRGGPARGADRHPEALVSTPGVVVGDDGLARPVWASVDPLLRDYYDTEWGMPVRDERGMFERLSLEAFQSGLSWATILRKRPAFREAFAGFDPEVVAAYGDADVERLMADAGIVRNRAKVLATITNARATLALREDPEGDLAAFVWSFRPADTPRPQHVRRRADHVAGVARPVQGAQAQGVRVRRADHDVRAHGGGRHRRHPPARLAPARQQRGLADGLSAWAAAADQHRSDDDAAGVRAVVRSAGAGRAVPRSPPARTS